MSRFIVCVTLLCLAFTAAAQEATPHDDDHPFLTLLSLVPFNDGVTPIITYGDYRAAESARIRQVMPQTYADYDALDNFETTFWLWTFSRIAYLRWDVSQQFTRSAPALAETVGYDWFDIDRVLTFGLYPRSGVILSGDFDADAIGTAHAALNYTPAEINGVSAWCSPNGCESGGRIDTANTFNGTLFGSQLGRYQTFLLMPEHIISSTELNIMEQVTDAYNDDADSALDDAAYHLLARTITDPGMYDGVLIQAQIFPARSVMTRVDLTPFDSADAYLRALQRREIPRYMRPRAQWRDYPYGILPGYEAIIFADRQEGDEQVAIIAVAYADSATAQAALDEFYDRILNYSAEDQTRSRLPFLQQFVYNEIYAPRIAADAESGLSALVIEIRYPSAQEEQVYFRRENAVMQPAILYQFWLRGMDGNSFYPIWDIRLPDWYFNMDW